MSWSLLLLAIGCAEYNIAGQVSDPSAFDEQVPEQYQLVVYPGQEQLDDGGVRAFPVRLPEIDFQGTNDVDFQRPVAIQGTVIGLNGTPRVRANLPGSVSAVDATVTFRGLEALADHRSQTDEDGAFQAFVAPGSHEVFVRPASPLVPPTAFALDVTPEDSPDLDIDLTEFAPIWGRITRGAAALTNARVRLVFADGSTGPEATTDADGWYELRATEGLVVGLRSSGSGNGIDPILETPALAVGSQGLRHDFAYDSTPLHTVAARALTVRQQALSAVPYRLTSTALDAYPTGRVELTGFTDTSGNLTARVIPGTYELTLLMDRETELTSVQLPITVTGDLDLGVLQVTDLTSVRGTVLDALGAPLQGAAVTCREIGFEQRTWTTSTGEGGEYTLSVAAGPLFCGATAGNPDLAASRESIDARETTQLDFTLTPGVAIRGFVTFEGTPEEFALVEAVDDAGTVWATAVTDGRGEYLLRLHPPDPGDPAE